MGLSSADPAPVVGNWIMNGARGWSDKSGCRDGHVTVVVFDMTIDVVTHHLASSLVNGTACWAART